LRSVNLYNKGIQYNTELKIITLGAIWVNISAEAKLRKWK